MRKLMLMCAAIVVAAWAGPAWAHVTVQPQEATTGSFARFVVRVPNERPDAGTVKVEVRFPGTVTNASFQPKAGWTRTVTMKTLDEPVEVFGEPVTEVIDTVTWEGGRIEPGEFDEFGFTVRTPDEPQELVFLAIQTYSSGEEVRWIGEADSDEPAARVTVKEAAAGHGADSGTGAPDGEGVEGDEQGGVATASPSPLPTALGGLGTVLGAAALAVALRRR
jgi:uncharacterized protein YcnI